MAPAVKDLLRTGPRKGSEEGDALQLPRPVSLFCVCAPPAASCRHVASEQLSDRNKHNTTR